MTYEEFCGKPEHYGSVERFLQLAIESLTDIGNHVVVDGQLGVVNWHSDIPNILAARGHITEDLKARWIRMIGFRNVLVHDYLEIDRRIVFDVLQNCLGDLYALRTTLARYL